MKRLINYLGAPALLLIVLTACHKDKPQPATPAAPVVHTNFYATISDQPWEASAASAQFSGGHLKISATPQNKSVLEFDLNDTIPGTYPIDSLSDSKATYSSDSSTYTSDVHSYNGMVVSGQVVITKIDKVNKTVTGTFKMILKNSINGKLINIEDGHINAIPFGPLVTSFTGDTLFISYLKTADRSGFYYTLRNPVSGEFGYKQILNPANFNPGDNVDFNKTTGRYIMFPTSGTGGFFDMYSGTQEFSFGVQQSAAPVVLSDTYYRFEMNNNHGLVKFSGTNGAFQTLIVSDSLVPLPFQATDGMYIYQTSGDTLRKIEPGSRTRTQYPFVTPINVYSMDYAGTNGILAVKQTVVGSTVKTYLVKINIVGLNAVDVAIADLKMDNVSVKNLSCTYNQSTNTFYVAAYDLTSTTYFAEVNLSTASVNNFSIPGQFRGIEAIH